MAKSTIEDGYFENLAKFSGGVFLLIALLTQGTLDPTPFNPVWPPGGPENFFGLPGAFCAGFLQETLGACAYSVPLLLLVFSYQKKVSRLYKLGHFFLALSVIVTTFALMFPQDYPGLPSYTGVWGVASHSILIRFPGRIVSLVVLIPTLMLSLINLSSNEFVLSYAYSLASMIRDGSKSVSRLFTTSLNRVDEKTRRRFGGALSRSSVGFSRLGVGLSRVKDSGKMFFLGIKDKKLFDISLPFKEPSRAKTKITRADPDFSEPANSVFHKALEEYEKELLLHNDGETPSSGERFEDLFEDLIDEEG